MEFCQSCDDIFRRNTPEAYERMILASLEGDDSWFSKWNQIELSWKFIEELKGSIRKLIYLFIFIKQGSSGPKDQIT